MQKRLGIGDTVTHRPDLYGMTESVITEYDRVFYNNDGGLAYAESHLGSMHDGIKWEVKEVDGIDCLIIHPWESTTWSCTEEKMVPCMTKKEVVKLSHWSCTVTNDKMNTMIPESVLKLKKKAEVSNA